MHWLGGRTLQDEGECESSSEPTNECIWSHLGETEAVPRRGGYDADELRSTAGARGRDTLQSNVNLGPNWAEPPGGSETTNRDAYRVN